MELFGRNAIGFTEDRKIILETTQDRVDFIEQSVISTLKQVLNINYIRPLVDSEHINIACSLVNYWSHLYAHWLLEGLTQLEALEHYSEKTGEKPVLIIDKDPPPWKVRSLEVMGDRIEDCQQWNGYRAKVEKLVICSKRREGGRTSVRACHWLRNRILSNINNLCSSDVILSQNIFISRKKAPTRHILNEE